MAPAHRPDQITRPFIGHQCAVRIRPDSASEKGAAKLPSCCRPDLGKPQEAHLTNVRFGPPRWLHDRSASPSPLPARCTSWLPPRARPLISTDRDVRDHRDARTSAPRAVVAFAPLSLSPGAGCACQSSSDPATSPSRDQESQSQQRPGRSDGDSRDWTRARARPHRWFCSRVAARAPAACVHEKPTAFCTVRASENATPLTDDSFWFWFPFACYDYRRL